MTKHTYTTKEELNEKIESAEKLYNLVNGNDYNFTGCRTNSDRYQVVARKCLEAVEKELGI